MGLVEKLGRRRLLLISQLGTFLSLLLIIGSVYMVDSADMGIGRFPQLILTKLQCLRLYLLA